MALIYFYIFMLIVCLIPFFILYKNRENLRKSGDKCSKYVAFNTTLNTDLTQYKGKIGESQVHNILMNLPDDFIILDDVVLLTNNGL